MSSHHPNAAANLFGGKGFWTFAILISVVFAAVVYFNGENEKADTAKESARVDALATEETAVAKCEQWIRQQHDGPGFRVISLDVVGRNHAYRTFTVDAVIQQQAPLNKKLFRTTERCNVYWSGLDDAWDIRVR